MGRKSKIDFDEKLNAVKQYLSGSLSYAQVGTRYSVKGTTVSRWVHTYKAFGEMGLKEVSRNQSYSKKLKSDAVEEYLAGRGSLENIRCKYGLKSDNQLLQWIKKYNGHEEIKKSNSGGTLMTKGRKTTLDERIEIVKYCIEHDNDYVSTSSKFDVSYQQARNWTKKYESKGLEGLKDRRGKKKPVEEMSEVEKLKAEMKLLEAKNKRLEMENNVLKKLKEIERRWE